MDGCFCDKSESGLDEGSDIDIVVEGVIVVAVVAVVPEMLVGVIVSRPAEDIPETVAVAVTVLVTVTVAVGDCDAVAEAEAVAVAVAVGEVETDEEDEEEDRVIDTSGVMVPDVDGEEGEVGIFSKRKLSVAGFTILRCIGTDAKETGLTASAWSKY